MNKKPIDLSPQDINIKQIALDILRDMYAASRKLMMYPMDHPVAIETLKKPMMNLNALYSYKCSFVIKVYNKRLAAEGLLLEDNVYVNGILYDLTKHGIDSVAFKSDVTPGDLFHFLTKLIESKSPSEDYIKKYLHKQDVRSIVINDPNSATIFNFDDTLIGREKSNYNLKSRLLEILSHNPDVIHGSYQGVIRNDDDIRMSLGIDLRYYTIKKLFPEAMAKMPQDRVLDVFQRIIYSTDWLDESIDEKKLEGLRKLWKDYASQSEDVSILLPIYIVFKSVGVTDELLEKVFDRGALIKLKAVRDAEEYIELLKSSKAKEISFSQLRKTVFKLATDSHSNPLEKLLKQLLKGINSETLDTRQRSLRLTIEALQTLTDGSFWELYGAFIREIIRSTHKPASGQELIELLGWVIENSAENDRWEELKICSQTLRGIAQEKSELRSAKALSQLSELMNSAVLTDILTDAAISGKGDNELYEALAALRSPYVASQLLDKIDHHEKTVRARVIRSLVTMGKDIGPDVVSKLASIVGQGETDDDRAWYKLRNLMRVLGQIRYIAALPYFEVMAGWNQKRLKYEIITSCEYMQSPSAGVVLSKLALDNDQEIRKAAVIAMGLSEHPDMIKFLRTLFDDPRSEKILIIEAVGRIGGIRARDILIDLYEDNEIYNNLGISTKEEEHIKVAILKSLSKIGDDVSRSKIELYSSIKKGGFLKKDVLSSTATNLLKQMP